MRVEVYSAADEVELEINGRSVDRAAAGESNRFKAEFETIYEPGRIVAVAYAGGRETGRMELRSASGDVLLDVAVDRTEIAADDTDLAYITITLVDGSGNLYNTADRKVAIEVKGPGVLQGFGGANPLSEENFFDTVRGTFEGRAVAVVRPTAVGTITVTLTADDCDAQTVRIDAVDFKTQKRAPKMTASFFREVAARNRVM